MGCYAIQLARLSPSNPLIVTTASPSNNEYLESLGADYVLDYHSPNWTKQAREISKREGAEFKWALDCIAEGISVGKSSEVFESEGGGKIATLRAPTHWFTDGIKIGVKTEYFSSWTLLGKEFWYNGKRIELGAGFPQLTIALFR